MCRLSRLQRRSAGGSLTGAQDVAAPASNPASNPASARARYLAPLWIRLRTEQGSGLLASRLSCARSHPLHGGRRLCRDCKCRETLDQSMRMIAKAGCGVVLYLHILRRASRSTAPRGGERLPARRNCRAAHGDRFQLCADRTAQRTAGGRTDCRPARAHSSAPSAWAARFRRPGHPAHPFAHQLPRSYSGPGWLRLGDRRAGVDPGRGVEPVG